MNFVQGRCPSPVVKERPQTNFLSHLSRRVQVTWSIGTENVSTKKYVFLVARKKA